MLMKPNVNNDISRNSPVDFTFSQCSYIDCKQPSTCEILNSGRDTIFVKITTHLKLTLQDMFRSLNDHQLKVELIEVTLLMMVVERPKHVL